MRPENDQYWKNRPVLRARTRTALGAAPAPSDPRLSLTSDHSRRIHLGGHARELVRFTKIPADQPLEGQDQSAARSSVHASPDRGNTDPSALCGLRSGHRAPPSLASTLRSQRTSPPGNGTRAPSSERDPERIPPNKTLNWDPLPSGESNTRTLPRDGNYTQKNAQHPVAEPGRCLQGRRHRGSRYC